MKALLGLVMAVALIAPSQAAPVAVPNTSSNGSVVLVEGGCGHDYHRDDHGYCRPNWREWEPGWRACPPGWHLGGEGHRCWPN
jgi:hypothetical protein